MRGGGFVKGLFLVLLAILLVVAVTDVCWPESDTMDPITNEKVSETMFGDQYTSGYAFVVLMIGLLLLVAILGGVFLAKEEKE